MPHYLDHRRKWKPKKWVTNADSSGVWGISGTRAGRALLSDRNVLQECGSQVGRWARSLQLLLKLELNSKEGTEVPANFLLHNAFMDSHLCQIIRLTNHKPEGRLSQATHPQSCIKLKLKGANSVIHLQWMRGKRTQRKSLLLSAEKSTSLKIRGPINHLICLSHSWVDAKENTTQVEKNLTTAPSFHP